MTYQISAFFSIAPAESCLKNFHVAFKKNPTSHISPSSWDMLTEVGNVISNFFSPLSFLNPFTPTYKSINPEKSPQHCHYASMLSKPHMYVTSHF